jgi:hypothetical protein
MRLAIRRAPAGVDENLKPTEIMQPSVNLDFRNDTIQSPNLRGRISCGYWAPS